MIDVLSVVLLIIVLCGVKRTKGFNEEYLSFENTNAIKGFFALLIVFHHIYQRVTSGLFYEYTEEIGFLSVAVFFFFSGYGLQKQYIARREKYSEMFLLKRLPKIIIPYVIVNVIYFVFYNGIGQKISIKDAVLGFIYGAPIVNFSWYVIDILFLYFAYWLAMKLCRKKDLLIVLFVLVYIIIKTSFCFKMGYKSNWYKTTHVVLIGMLWAIFETKITSAVKKHTGVLILSGTFIMTALYIICRRLAEKTIDSGLDHRIYMAIVMLTAIVMATVVVIYSMCFTGSNVMKFIGKISFEIYLMQGIFICGLRNDYIYIKNDCLYLIISFAGTIITAYIMNKLFKAVLSKYSSVLNKFTSRKLSAK